MIPFTKPEHPLDAARIITYDFALSIKTMSRAVTVTIVLLGIAGRGLAVPEAEIGTRTNTSACTNTQRPWAGRRVQ